MAETNETHLIAHVEQRLTSKYSQFPLEEISTIVQSEVARFADTVGRVFVSLAPEHLTQEFNKVDRGGRIYVDIGMRNERKRTGSEIEGPLTMGNRSEASK